MSGIELRATLEVVLAGGFCGALGFWVLSERLAYAGESLSHGMLRASCSPPWRARRCCWRGRRRAGGRRPDRPGRARSARGLGHRHRGGGDRPGRAGVAARAGAGLAPAPGGAAVRRPARRQRRGSRGGGRAGARRRGRPGRPAPPARGHLVRPGRSERARAPPRPRPTGPARADGRRDRGRRARASARCSCWLCWSARRSPCGATCATPARPCSPGPAWRPRPAWPASSCPPRPAPAAGASVALVLCAGARGWAPRLDRRRTVGPAREAPRASGGGGSRHVPARRISAPPPAIIARLNSCGTVRPATTSSLRRMNSTRKRSSPPRNR